MSFSIDFKILWLGLFFLFACLTASGQDFSILNDKEVYYNYNNENSPVSSTINKCYCSPTEVYVDEKCIEDERLVIEIQNSTVTMVVKDLECPSEWEVVELPSKSYEFKYNANMHTIAMDEYVPANLYCTENTRSETGDITSFIKICLVTPVFPKCCSSNEMLEIKDTSIGGNSSVSCLSSTDENSDINMQTYIDRRLVSWPKPQFVQNQIHCPEDYEIITTTLEQIETESHLYMSIRGSGIILYWKNNDGKEDYFTHAEFCLNSAGSDDVQAYFCYQSPHKIHENVCEGHSCIRKCCPEGEIYNHGIGCDWFESSIDWKPVMYNEDTLIQENLTDASSYKVVHGEPLCENHHRIESDDPYALMSSGRMKEFSQRNYFPATQYCVDLSIQNGNVSNLALLCFRDVDQSNSCFGGHVMQVIAFLISCIFIIATLFVYLSVTEIFMKLSSKCVVSESIALLLSFICLTSLRFTDRREGPSVICIGTGIILYYSFLASFFWLNVMCFDLYFTINSLVPVNDEGSSKRNRFLKYSAYGWGIPLIFVIVACIIDNIELVVENSYIVRPNIIRTCFIPSKDYEARWAYIYGPVLVILTINLILFIMVAISLVKTKRKIANALQNKESHTHAGGNGSKNMSNDKESALLCIKLFLVMGITWITDVLSFASGDSCYIWLFTDLINCLRGLFMFLIFVCKRDVIRKFKVTWRKKLNMKPPSSSSASKSKTVISRWWNRIRSGEEVEDNSISSEGNSFWSAITTATTSIFVSHSVEGGVGESELSELSDISLPYGSQNVIALQNMETFNKND